ncbi:MAG: hypothetical protein ACLQVL_28265 [Terriglobia bacterium]
MEIAANYGVRQLAGALWAGILPVCGVSTLSTVTFQAEFFADYSP